MMHERLEQRLEHDGLIEQQQKERMLAPYRAHEAARRREAEAPLEKRRMDADRERRLRSHLAQIEEEISENKRQKARERMEMLEQRREEHEEVVQRVEAAHREKAFKRLEQMNNIALKNEATAKREAKRTLKQEAERKQRLELQKAEAAMKQAVWRSSISGEVLTESTLEAIVANKKGRP
eukprot:CAMPEP_0115833112 /NCGR_PEP_ID=MMETSP0287-20121206/3005_1 /TAXON_ID=412157 /ORGANISM="Chrysochromulina rotalis, Strain UIO044" /LENGTH=179 /DNA_ID=CAMNT_0003286517 /DNA_START=24 /DNA_END=563 /DNA_ORIENTATION=+